MQTYTRKFDFGTLSGGRHWADAVADQIIATHPDLPLYTAAAGISPSGVVHFGNFRDIVTSHLVREALKARGKNARLLFSWDNFDRFRKVPANVDASFAAHIGKPLTKIPDPQGELSSYAERFQQPFIEAMERLDIEIEFRDQTAMYESGAYDDAIFHALREREQIADILLSFMTDKAKGEKGIDPESYRSNYYPISIYSRFTGKDVTKVLHYDGEHTVTYLCVETGKEDTADLSIDHIAKLAWKPDWAMRWQYEGVHFEPGGHDHASPGGSYDTSSVITNKIFNYTAPVFVEYKFVGIQGLGSKMSGSKGNAVSPLELLNIYEPDLLRSLYFSKSPHQSFELAFNTEIYRQYEEYDAKHPEQKAIPFRQAVGFGQIVQWQPEKLATILTSLGLDYDAASIARRLPLARNWLTTYNPNEAVTLRDTVHTDYASTLSPEHRAQIVALRDALVAMPEASVADLEALVYSIPKSPDLDEAELKKAQRTFFKHVYNLLLGKDTGPRLGTFLWAIDRDKAIALLTLAE